MTGLIYYLILINLITLIIFLFDKMRAVDRGWRVPEWGLWFLSAVGGSIGGLIAMQIGRHKRQKHGFVIIMWLILIIQLLIIWQVINKNIS